MAQRRMFSLKIVDSDAFLDMGQTAQLLYFHLSMRADDDGFIGNPKKIMRMIGSSEDDMKVLLSKRFILPFESGIVVIKHWKIHNYIQNDRYTPTQYTDELKQLSTKENGSYTESVQNGYRMETQVRLGKVRLGKDSIDKEESRRFTPPSLQEVQEYCLERKNTVNAETFIDFYTSKGWRIGKEPMRDWKAAVRTWEKRDNQTNKPKRVTIKL